MINAINATRNITRNAAFGSTQRRPFVTWLMNRADKVMEYKAIQMKGGICQGADNPTWLKQKGDVAAVAVIGVLTTCTMIGVAVGMNNLSNGTGKHR